MDYFSSESITGGSSDAAVKNFGLGEWVKVVAHTKKGELKYGLCNALETQSNGVELFLHDREGRSLNQRILIAYNSLKALFVVKSFDGSFTISSEQSADRPAMEPIAVEFDDGEVLIARPVETKWKKATRILLKPEDQNSNNKLVLAERSAIKNIYDYQEYKQRQQEEFMAFAKSHFMPGMSHEECLGDFFFAKHDYAHALEHYRIAFERDRANGQLRKKIVTTKYNIGVRYIKQKDYVRALRFMELALALDPNHKDVQEKVEKLRERLRVQEALTDVRSKLPGCMDSDQLRRFIECNWVRQHQHFVMTGPARSGKTRLACAIGHKVSKKGMKVVYHRLPVLLKELQTARNANKDTELLEALELVDFLIIDDWSHELLTEQDRKDLREVILGRYLRRSTLFIAELPEGEWHHLFGNHAITDPLLNKVLHDAHKIHLLSEASQK